MFAEGELRALVAGAARVDECYYDEGNWAVRVPNCDATCFRSASARWRGAIGDVVLVASARWREAEQLCCVFGLPPPLIKNNLRGACMRDERGILDSTLSFINARRLSKIKFCVVPQSSADR